MNEASDVAVSNTRHRSIDLTGFRHRPGRAAASAASAAVGVVLLLSGCIADSHRFAIFDQKAEPTDAPADVAELDVEVVDVESLRFAIENEGDLVYLARPADGIGICMVVDTSPGGLLTGCSSNGSWVSVEQSGGHEYHVRPDGTPPRDSYAELTENISIKSD